MSASATFLYVGNGETRDVSAFALDDQNGDLAPIDTFAVPAAALNEALLEEFAKTLLGQPGAFRKYRSAPAAR